MISKSFKVVQNLKSSPSHFPVILNGFYRIFFSHLDLKLGGTLSMRQAKFFSNCSPRGLLSWSLSFKALHILKSSPRHNSVNFSGFTWCFTFGLKLGGTLWMRQAKIATNCSPRGLPSWFLSHLKLYRFWRVLPATFLSFSTVLLDFSHLDLKLGGTL